MDAIKKWLAANKKIVGWVITFIGGGLYATDNKPIAEFLGFLAAALLGGGYLKSDTQVQDDHAIEVIVRKTLEQFGGSASSEDTAKDMALAKVAEPRVAAQVSSVARKMIAEKEQ